MTVREAIRQHLVTTLATQIGERCYEPQMPDAQTPKPYLVLRLGPEDEDTAWTGYRQLIEVWPCVARTQFVNVDTLAAAVAAALDGVLLTAADGTKFTCLYQGVIGNDQPDTELDIITRGLRFAVLALQPVAVEETQPDDPWLVALIEVSRDLLGEDWAIYGTAWPSGYGRPSVLWRLAGVEAGAAPANAAMYEVRKKFIGHVLGDTPNRQNAGINTLVNGLHAMIKIPLDAENRRYLTVKSVTGNNQADAIRAGQISLTLSRRTSQPEEEAALIMHVHRSGLIKQ